MMSGRVDIALEDRVAVLTLAHPGRRNAISAPMWDRIAGFAKEAGERGDIRLVVLRGSEGTFSAGADISGFEALRSGEADAASYDDLVESTCRAVESIPQPVIAAIEGLCLGAGASLAASCDIRIACESASFGVPAARLGLGYDARGIERFRRVFGHVPTLELLLTAQRIPAARAHQLGAVSALAAPGRLDAEVQAWSRRLVANAPLTQRAAKTALRAIARGDAALRALADEQARQADASDDYREGRAAFAEKREPRFEGR